MRLLITGASGFLGQHLVTEALQAGHHVRALDLPADGPPGGEYAERERLEIVTADLRNRHGLETALAGADCVIHAAAKMTGTQEEQHEGTVVATQNLLAAMEASGVGHIVLVGTFSVYGYQDIPMGSTVTEDSPLERRLAERDVYARTKTEQEMLVRAHAIRLGWKWTVMRVGVLYGKGRLFGSRCGVALDPRTWVVLSTTAELPLTYVENCAQCIVLAAASPAVTGQVINVLDNAPPRQREYIRMLQARVRPKPRVIAIPWGVFLCVATLARFVAKVCFRGRAKLPGLLVPARLHALYRPLRYTNEKALKTLNWTPRHTLAEALDRCTE